jgi:hypothetical protein
MNYGNLLDKSRPVPATITYGAVRPILKWVYAWMMIGLLVTAGVAFFTATTPALLQLSMNPVIAIGAFAVQIVLVIALGFLINRVSPAVAAVMFLLYAATLGFSLSILMLAFDVGSLAAAFGTTAILFGIMTIVGFTTDIDLSKFGNLLIMAVIGLIVAMVVNIFIGSSFLTFIISIVGVLIFMGLTAYDTQNIKRMAASPEIQADGTLAAKVSIFGALSLYINFINIFLFLLRIMGGGGSR